MKKALHEWWTRPARPWEFWLPQSGLVGGVFFGLVLILVFKAALP